MVDASRKAVSSSVRSGDAAARHSVAACSSAPRYSSESGRPSESHPSAAADRWRRTRCPAASSSSHAAQPWPCPRQRFVGELDAIVVGGDEAGAHEQAEDACTVGIAAERSGGDARAHRLAVGRRRDESHQQRAQLRPLLGGQALVEAVGGAGDGAPDLAGCPVRLDREHPSITPLPRFREGVRQQREGAGLALAVAYEQVDEPVLELQACLLSGALDGLAQRVSRQRHDEVHAALGEPGERRISGQRGNVVTAHGDDDRGLLDGVAGEPGAETAHTRSGRQRSRTALRTGRRQARGCRRTSPVRSPSLQRDQHLVRTPRRCAPVLRSAGTTPARTSDDLPQPDGPVTTSNGFSASRSRHVATSSVRPKNVSESSTSYGARPLYGQCSAIAGGAGGASRLSSWRRIAAFERRELRPGLDPQLDERVPRPLQRPQGVSLAATPVQGEGEQRPAVLTERLLGHPRFGNRDHVTVVAEVQSGLDQALLGDPAQLPSRAAAICPGSHESRSSNGGPRHNSNALPSETAARSNSPAANSTRPRSTSCSKRWLSTSSPSAANR